MYAQIVECSHFIPPSLPPSDGPQTYDPQPAYMVVIYGARVINQSHKYRFVKHMLWVWYGAGNLRSTSIGTVFRFDFNVVI